VSANAFSARWLALREPADAAARSADLGHRFAAALPRDRVPLLVDLAAGTGSNARALAPLVARDQSWLLVERDAALLAAQAAAFRAWAGARRWPVTVAGGVVTVSVPGARWRFESVALDLAGDWLAIGGRDFAGVTAAAFFDLVGKAWLLRFVRWTVQRRLPLLAALTVDGRRDWHPAASEDAVVAAAFPHHQRRDKGFGPALGGAAPAALSRLLAAETYRLVETPSDWRIDVRHVELLRELIRGDAAAAREAAPEAAAVIDRWERRRQEEARTGALNLTIGHRDLLALPR
jgi:hypothetical protein